jgi:hypothetical protein
VSATRQDLARAAAAHGFGKSFADACLKSDIAELLKRVESLKPTAWKSVADEMPAPDTTVLIYSLGNYEPVWPGYWDGEEWRYRSERRAHEVTHWMYFPEPPEVHS